jgi:hypothetical protein
MEQSKIPDFFGQKAKDTIRALDFIQHIDDLTKTDSWTDTVTYNNFANPLKGVVRRWLYSMVDTLNYTDYELIWSTFKPLLQNQFALQSNNKLIMEGLSNFAMMPTEDT